MGPLPGLGTANRQAQLVNHALMIVSAKYQTAAWRFDTLKISNESPSSRESPASRWRVGVAHKRLYIRHTACNVADYGMWLQ